MTPELETLIFNAYHGELTDTERDTLSRWAEESPANARLLIMYANESRGIELALRSAQAAQADMTIESTDDVFQDMACEVIAGRIDQTLASGERRDEENTAEQTLETGRFLEALPLSGGRPGPAAGSHKRSVLAAAAMLGIAALLGVAFWLGGAKTTPDRPGHTELPAPAPQASLAERRTDTPVSRDRPAALGQVRETLDSDLIFYTDGGQGNRTPIGNMPYGRSWYWFLGRGGVLIEAPAMWQMLEGDDIRLLEGRLMARAAEDAYEPLKFLIDRSVITLQDGQFGIYRTGPDTAAIIVFAGSIEVSLAPSQGVSSVETLGAGRAGVLQTHLGTIEQQTPASADDAAPFADAMLNMRYRPLHKTRSVIYRIDAPRSLSWGDVDDSAFAQIIRESPGVAVGTGELAAMEQESANMVALSAGQAVDSYILHYAPTGDEASTDAMIEGMIAFDRPIVAVLGSSDSIRATDTRYGSPETAYPRSAETAGGPEGSESWGIETTEDYVELSEDRKRLFFRLHTGSDLDQVRILVEAR